MITGHTDHSGQEIHAGDTVRCTSLSCPGVVYEGEVYWSQNHGWHAIVPLPVTTLHILRVDDGLAVRAMKRPVDPGPGRLPLGDPGWRLEIVRAVPRPCEDGGGI